MKRGTFSMAGVVGVLIILYCACLTYTAHTGTFPFAFQRTARTEADNGNFKTLRGVNRPNHNYIHKCRQQAKRAKQVVRCA